ncbi:MAG: serpin family protein [Muribaculaceae bacterium]|nr:serpin family protein [Muribaculaceae bacterium]
MKKHLFMLSLLMSLSMFSCTSNGDVDNDINDIIDNKPDSTAQEWEVVTTTYKEWAQNNSLQPWFDYLEMNKKVDLFSERLTDEVGKLHGNEGFVMSPLSVATQLAIIANSSDSSARKEILEAFDFNSTDEFNDICGSLLWHLDYWFKDYSQIVNNHIWVSNNCTPGNDYLKKMAQCFNVGVEKIDFSDPSTVSTINDWMSRYSQGMITDYVTNEMFNGQNHLMASAYYLNVTSPRAQGTSYQIEQDVFHSPDGDVMVDMIKKLNYAYACGASNEVADMISFFIGPSIWLSVYVPKSNIEAKDLTTIINRDVRRELQDKSQEVDWTVKMPLFDCTSKLNLIPVLETLGIKTLNNLDLSPAGIVDSETRVFHQGRAEFKADDFRLTTMTTNYDESVQLVINRPFIFTVGTLSGTYSNLRSTIMTGVIVNPTK